MYKIGILDSKHHSYVLQPDLEQQVFDGVAELQLFHVSSVAELPEWARACDGFISWHLVPLDAGALQQLTSCRAIVRAAVGYDNIDLGTAAGKGIQVANVPDYGTEEVADHTLAMALALLRRLPRGDQLVRGGCWDWRQVGGMPRLRGFNVGLLGLGRIGTAVARRFQALGCEVSFYDPERPSGWDKAVGVQRCESLDELLERCQLLSIHAPLNPTTRHLIDAEALARLDGKYLVNTARGPIIDPQALNAAIAANSLAGVGLDVFADETQRPPEPLASSPDVLWSPHVAFYADPALAELRIKAAQCLRGLLEQGHHRNVLSAVASA
ncbi:C-terminal binding protein [Azohydromonas lata]|uniref:C-terminal binding protein n=1 Tax=Azohydromonas lata TaxID=45677 RepID=A0ABU5IS39_9BURK|nr:C-terminal binding protein [Azohydromonas lata]MDZ5461685.1 C-terminal binding protein [Azohydromonas lata]